MGSGHGDDHREWSWGMVMGGVVMGGVILGSGYWGRANFPS